MNNYFNLGRYGGAKISSSECTLQALNGQSDDQRCCRYSLNGPANQTYFLVKPINGVALASIPRIGERQFSERCSPHR